MVYIKAPKNVILELASQTTLTRKTAKILASSASDLFVFLRKNIYYLMELLQQHSSCLILNEVIENVKKLKIIDTIFQSTKFVNFPPPLKTFNSAKIRVGMKYSDW